MTWSVDFDERALRELRSLDHQAQRRILRYLRTRIATGEDPRRFGKPLRWDKSGLWRYRIGSYRVICSIEDQHLTVLVVRVGDRKNVYD